MTTHRTEFMVQTMSSVRSSALVGTAVPAPALPFFHDSVDQYAERPTAFRNWPG